MAIKQMFPRKAEQVQIPAEVIGELHIPHGMTALLLRCEECGEELFQRVDDPTATMTHSCWRKHGEQS